ncbi:hypothetical protein IC800_13165 [Acinetobacter seifertii]|jgi:hypothetical protein|uniref:Uncharacterized protein n=4 Tax=Acinetobacter TaxID=469 RepID=N8QVL3_9GAMM|nr:MULTISPECIES: hypothetical protein [Acinetobacter]KHO15161.1 hypothetical protein NT90_12300 [Acinetobacter baumannii]ENU42630.1 hypothetical protein F985_03522 [Acinetobacter seifertii]MBD1219947.1 hypothetical protein [Acinetobacter seifertii]MBD1230681.1 hypothetical protein [Acinetobacter seifertii]MBJ8504445.1 hypothetical protein [Acinetobacter seifertii]
MCVHKNIYPVFTALIIFYSGYVQAYDFFQPESDSTLLDTEQLLDQSDLNLEQRRLAIEHDDEVNNYNVLKNEFYSNERWVIYNYTAYDTGQLQNKNSNGLTNHINIQDLSISVGYGVNYSVNPRLKIGYEYISSFPYDRGQLIRFFTIYLF